VTPNLLKKLRILKMNILKYFGYKWNYLGFVETKVLCIIPFLLYLTKSTIRGIHKSKSGGVVYALHFTPWITIGFNGASSDAGFTHKNEEILKNKFSK
jgi:hypothetical protein